MRILLLSLLTALDVQAGAFQGGTQSARQIRLKHAADVENAPVVRTISGQVCSALDHGPLEGVKVVVKGSQRYSGSWIDGAYYMPVKERDSVLEFSKDGYEPQIVRLGGLNEYNIVLKEAAPAAAVAPGFSALGEWRGVFEPRAGLEVPFNFEIRKTAKGVRIFFLNAEEKFDGGQVRQSDDSLWVSLESFDNELAFAIRDNARIEGVLRRQDGKGNPIPVHAETGKSYRFKEGGVAPAGNVSGTYDIVFNGQEKAVGVFQQDGNKLRATFLRVTGDSRYLQGIVEGDHFYLSSFIGSGPSFYQGSFDGKGNLTGTIEGARGSQPFTGASNPSAALPDPYKLTYLKEGYHSLDFSFPDADGRLVSPKDEKYRGKVLVITIGGTWCPNCIDEIGFLAPWYKANKSRGVEIIAIQYERQSDPAFVKRALTKQRDRFDIEYDQVFGGLADKQGVASSLPALNSFLSYPTTIIIDKKGQVAEIHTGYNGPATGQYYDKQVKEFNATIDRLLKS